ncbi:MAG: beta-ketoacyl-ACP synthase III [Desulfovibrionaceae bacterium]|nr:beta-ketoacyl-ACP synthase III [Desulfovibrionaceae bacterium]
MTDLYIHSLALHTPERIVSNDDLSRIVDTSDEWIRTRTGIGFRHVAAEGENTSDLATRAALKALEKSGMDAGELTHVIVATGTQDNLSPSVACIVASNVGAGNVMAFDLSAACTGFIYGLSVCRAFLCADPGAKILFVCAETLTRRLDWQDRTTCVLFGDGAGAMVISASPEGALGRLEDCDCKSDGSARDLIIVGGGTACAYKKGDPVDSCFFIRMNGRETYKYAVRSMTGICRDLLARNSYTIGDVNLLVSHQANIRIVQAVGERLEISEDCVFTNLANYGNTSSASIPIALTEAWEIGRIKPGSLVLTTAFGSGLTWGAALIRF